MKLNYLTTKMGFELLEKLRKKPIKDNQISVSRTIITFGKGISESFQEKHFCKVYFDYQENKIGFKPSLDSEEGYKIGTEKQSEKRKLSVSSIPKKTSLGIYDAEFNEELNMWIIKVPELRK